MKIVAVSNLNIETMSDVLVSESIPLEYQEEAEEMVKALNNRYCTRDNSPRFFKLVPDDYKLYEFKY